MLFSELYKFMVNKVTFVVFRGAIAPIVPSGSAPGLLPHPSLCTSCILDHLSCGVSSLCVTCPVLDLVLLLWVLLFLSWVLCFFAYIYKRSPLMWSQVLAVCTVNLLLLLYYYLLTTTLNYSRYLITNILCICRRKTEPTHVTRVRDKTESLFFGLSLFLYIWHQFSSWSCSRELFTWLLSTQMGATNGQISDLNP